MNIWQRFRRLNVWKKLGAIGSICSILAFAGWLLFRLSDASVDVNVQDSPSANVQTAVESPGATQIIAEHVKIIIVTPSLERKLSMEPVYINKQEDGKYVSLWHGKLEASYPIPYLRVEVHGKTVENVELSPRRSGVSIGGPGGKREGYVFAELQNATGNLKLKVVTREFEKVEIRFSAEQ